MVTTWCDEIARVADGDVIIQCTLTHEELHKPFNDGYGGVEGEPFTAWSENYVYFPVCYDGSEWVERVPRNPNNEKTQHFGGG